MKRLNVFIDKKDRDELAEIWLVSKEPIFGVTTRMAFRQEKRVNDAYLEFYDKLDELAVKLGLPEPEKDEDGDVIHYGLDFRNCELLSVDEVE